MTVWINCSRGPEAWEEMNGQTAAQGSRQGRKRLARRRIREADRSALERLVVEIGRAARAGWAQTARLIALLTVTAGAVALILVTSR